MNRIRLFDDWRLSTYSTTEWNSSEHVEPLIGFCEAKPNPVRALLWKPQNAWPYRCL